MEHRIGVIGLGYVGLPLAVEFGKKYPTVGFDINEKRIGELRSAFDRTREMSRKSCCARNFSPILPVRKT